LLNRLQQESGLPLLISADFEGGPGQQIAGATEFPANMALSAIGSEDLAYLVGKVGATEGRAMGIHLTYSPVVDIQTQPDNPVLGVRSFGADIELLGRMAGAYIRGYQENGMLATAKHYPGRGDVELIPGTEFTINRKPAGQVETEDLAAFKKAIDAGVTFIMSEHIAVPSLTEGSDLPASVHETLARDWLRDRLGFGGILTTDDMWYEKVVRRFGAVKACVMTVRAGHDVILKPADAVATIEGLVEAVRKGEIPEKQIDQSVRKIIYWKARLNLHRRHFVDESRISSLVGTQEHKKIAQEIADRSLTLLKNDGFFPSEPSRLGKIVHLSLQRKEVDQAPRVVAARLKADFPSLESFFLGPHTSDRYYEEALKASVSADTVAISLFLPRTVYKDNGILAEKEMTFFEKVIALKPDSTIVMSYGNPYHADRFTRASAFLVGYGEGGFYGNQTIYADSFIKLLKGDISPGGRLPVRISDDFPSGSGIIY
jgi:beta-N-acetylhexosaminidase